MAYAFNDDKSKADIIVVEHEIELGSDSDYIDLTSQYGLQPADVNKLCILSIQQKNLNFTSVDIWCTTYFAITGSVGKGFVYPFARLETNDNRLMLYVRAYDDNNPVSPYSHLAVKVVLLKTQ